MAGRTINACLHLLIQLDLPESFMSSRADKAGCNLKAFVRHTINPNPNFRP